MGRVAHPHKGRSSPSLSSAGPGAVREYPAPSMCPRLQASVGVSPLVCPLPRVPVSVPCPRVPVPLSPFVCHCPMPRLRVPVSMSLSASAHVSPRRVPLSAWYVRPLCRAPAKPPPQGCIGRGGLGTPPPHSPPGRLAYAQLLSPSTQVPASMAFVTDSNRPQPLWQPPIQPPIEPLLGRAFPSNASLPLLSAGPRACPTG